MGYNIEIINGECKINGKPLEEYSKEEQAELHKDINVLCGTNNNFKFILDNNIPKDKIFIFPSDSPVVRQYAFDRLAQIFRSQEIFTNRVYEPFKDKPFNCYNFDKETFDLFYTLVRANIELSEALGLIDKHTKIWKNNKGEPYNKEKILEELIDAAKFIHQAILFLGYDEESYYQGHTKKDKTNHKRQDEGY